MKKIGIGLLLALASAHVTAGERPYVHDLDRRFDQYTWVSTHNAFNTGVLPNQTRSISRQLLDGVRGLSLDLHESAGRVKVCHASCALGGEPLATHLERDIIPFLMADREAIVTLHLEDYVSASALRAELARVPALAALTFDPDTWKTPGWPTLRQMIAANQRLLIFDMPAGKAPANAGKHTLPGGVVTFMSAEGSTTENYWSLGATIGTHDTSCKSRWSGSLEAGTARFPEKSWPRLFVMNHFHGTGEALHARLDNRYDKLAERVYGSCATAARRPPNFLVIDHYQNGDAFELAGVLNQGGMVLYKGNKGADEIVCGIPAGQKTAIDFKSDDRRGCENDDARSARLVGVPAGTTFFVYDSRDGSRSDDYATVRVLKDLTNRSVVIPSFHTSYADSDVSVSAHYKNGLDGKVSHVAVVPAP
jgi:hypothetical protein